MSATLPMSPEILFRLRRTMRATSRVLEVGCGNGLVAAALRPDGVSLRAVDEDVRRVQMAKTRGVDARLSDFSRLPFGDCEFDGIACLNVLSSIDEPLTLLREMRRVLRPGGLLVLSGPQPVPDRLMPILRFLRGRVFEADDRLCRGRDWWVAATL